MLKIVLLLLTIPLLCGWSTSGSTTTKSRTQHYIDQSGGNDAWTGTSRGDPISTIAQLEAATTAPDDEVYFQRGEIWREDFRIQQSGVANSPITYTAYGTGALPIIDGTDLTGVAAGDDWVVHAGSVYKTNHLTDPVNAVYFDGTIGVEDAAGCPAAVNALNEWCWLANVLYAYSAGGDPDTQYTSPGIEASVRNQALITNYNSYLDISYLQLEQGRLDGLLINSWNVTNPTNINVHNITVTNQEYRGILVGNIGAGFKTPNNVTISDSIIENWHRAFMAAAGPGTVAASAIFQTAGDGSGGDNLSIQRNTIVSDLAAGETNNDRNGIEIHTGNNILIEDNEIDSSEHGIYILGANAGAGYHAEEYTIRYNYIHDTRDDFIWISGPTATKTGSLIAYNLLVDSVNDNGMQLQSVGTDSYGTIVNNVIYNTENSAIHILFGCLNTVFKNNIIMNYALSGAAGEVGMELADAGTPNYGAGSDFDNNEYYKLGDTTPFWSLALGARTLAQWQGDMTAEASSLNSDPLFTTPGSDFTLQDPASPAIDAGTDVGETRDYIGNPMVGDPDMGAYEVQ